MRRESPLHAPALVSRFQHATFHLHSFCASTQKCYAHYSGNGGCCDLSSPNAQIAPMSHRRSRSNAGQAGDDSLLSSRSLEAFGRKVQATAGHLIGPIGESSIGQHYQNAIGDIHKELRHPMVQRQVFTLAQASPKEIVRSKLSSSEIHQRALTYIPDELLANVPEASSRFSLFQGFQATLPEQAGGSRRKHNRHASKGQPLIEASKEDETGSPTVSTLRNEKQGLDHKLEMLGVRKNMCSTEIREIDNKIANLNTMRQVVLERLANLEQEETDMERQLMDVDARLEDLEEAIEDAAVLAAGQKTPTQTSEPEAEPEPSSIESPDHSAMEASFMSESIYQKLPSPKAKRPRPLRRRTTHILHEHLQSGSKIREIQAHNDIISALDFDAPFGTMVTAALDDTIRVWDLNAGRCMGLLEGHLSSVRCLQVEENIVATGSMDATVRLWDLSQADYKAQVDSRVNKYDDNGELSEDDPSSSQSTQDNGILNLSAPPLPPASSMQDCPIFTLSAHVAEITALHFHNSTLISGSADKTLRQWDLEKGRCVQTLDVLWAAAQAQAATSINSSLQQSNSGIGFGGGSTQSDMTSSMMWRQAGRTADTSADFVGALQVFDAALACGTADGMVRLWDLRSGQVHRSLVGHTGAVTCLQFDDVHLVTGSLDRSIRIWDLRTGTIYDAFAYAHAITSMMFDARHIVAASGQDVVKVYDKTDGRHWDCGPGAGASRATGLVDGGEVEEQGAHATIGRVRIKDGYMIEGRRNGVVGVWSC